MNEAATMEFKSEGVKSSSAMKALLDSVDIKEVTLHDPAMGQDVPWEGDALTVQTDDDINP